MQTPCSKEDNSEHGKKRLQPAQRSHQIASKRGVAFSVHIFSTFITRSIRQ